MNILNKCLKLAQLLLFASFILLSFHGCDNEPVDPIIILDTDNDGIADNLDNCPATFNPDQIDSDSDGIGDLCDNDGDNDGVPDNVDNCPLISNPDQGDDDSDGIGNLCDDDYVPSSEPLAICENGFADIYPCLDYDLMSYVPIEELGGASAEGNDCWGWVDPSTQKEYALVGTSTGTAFVDVTTANSPIIVGKLPTASLNSPWRDIKVFENYALIVADNAGNHGMQIFDLRHLRDVTNPPEIFAPDANYTGVGSTHNVVVDEISAFAYLVGTNRNSIYQGATLFVDIENPMNPLSAGGLSEYSHDAQVVVYNGPDSEHVGKEIFIGCNENEIVIVDVTNKGNPVELSRISYSNVGYTHQGWLTEDMAYFIVGDELDEINFGNNTRTLIFDFTDLDNPSYYFEYSGPTPAIDHNGYVKGNLFYQASYTAGVRVIDITDIGTASMNEVGFFDTYPENNNTAFNGAWSVYPYLPSGNVIISDIDRGLFVVRKSDL